MSKKLLPERDKIMDERRKWQTPRQIYGFPTFEDNFLAPKISTEISFKCGVFLDGEKVAAKNHEFARIHHTFHHDLPSKKHQKSAKPPEKLPFCLSNFFSSIRIAKLRETCTYS
jgi:hypothetical protein